MINTLRLLNITKGSPLRRLWPLSSSCASIATILAVSGCLASSTGGIQVERELVLEPGHGGIPYVITPTKDGDFVIAGTVEGEAWASRISGNGDVRWSYFDKADSKTELPGGAGEFHGAVVLADKSTLLCGFTSGPNRVGRSGYLVRIDISGSVLSRERVYPNSDDQFRFTGFEGCVPWNDGFALFGAATKGEGRVGWIVKLNAKGSKEWEKTEPKTDWDSGIETADHELVLASSTRVPKLGVTLSRLSSSGEIVGRRFIECHHFDRVLPTFSSINTYIAATTWPEVRLYSLGKDLRDLTPERRIQSINLDRARLYLFPDDSLVIFGNIQKGGDAYTAAVARVGSNSKLTKVHIFEPEFASFSASDAVQISSNAFLAVRDGSTAGSGVILDWVSIK